MAPQKEGRFGEMVRRTELISALHQPVGAVATLHVGPSASNLWPAGLAWGRTLHEELWATVK
jgi:hypothetical protein